MQDVYCNGNQSKSMLKPIPVQNHVQNTVTRGAEGEEASIEDIIFHFLHFSKINMGDDHIEPLKKKTMNHYTR